MRTEGLGMETVRYLQVIFISRNLINLCSGQFILILLSGWGRIRRRPRLTGHASVAANGDVTCNDVPVQRVQGPAPVAEFAGSLGCTVLQERIVRLAPVMKCYSRPHYVHLTRPTPPKHSPVGSACYCHRPIQRPTCQADRRRPYSICFSTSE